MLRNVVPNIGGHWTVTSNGTHDSAKSFNYVLKEDYPILERLHGPGFGRVRGLSNHPSLPQSHPAILMLVHDNILVFLL